MSFESNFEEIRVLRPTPTKPRQVYRPQLFTRRGQFEVMRLSGGRWACPQVDVRLQISLARQYQMTDLFESLAKLGIVDPEIVEKHIADVREARAAQERDWAMESMREAAKKLGYVCRKRK